MKNRYLFRGKTGSGNWIEGLLSANADRNKFYISNKAGSPFAYEIIPETICQCTGLRDKNGKLIWENDIVKLPREDENFLVEWDEDTDTGRYVLNGDGAEYDFDGLWSQSVEIVGNLFDDQELLEWKAF